MNTHQYRVTIEHLYTPHAAEDLDPPLVFETTNQDALMLLFIVNRLRANLNGTRECGRGQDTPRRVSTRPL